MSKTRTIQEKIEAMSATAAQKFYDDNAPAILIAVRSTGGRWLAARLRDTARNNGIDVDQFTAVCLDRLPAPDAAKLAAVL